MPGSIRRHHLFKTAYDAVDVGRVYSTVVQADLNLLAGDVYADTSETYL